MKFETISMQALSYPGLLRNIFDPPKELNIWGMLPDFELHPPVAVVGSRKPTDYGREAAIIITAGLAKAGFSVISGLAYGIDSIAHKACLENGGITVAVLGGGLEKLYPKTHEKLAADIVKSGGAVISEFENSAPSLPFNFPKRNRVISGMSLGVVVVEAAIDSGTLITARSALEQGREVFAVPGPIGNVNTAGTHRLLRDGAALIESAQDIIDELEPRLSSAWKSKFSGQSFGIGDKERKILNLLNEVPAQVDNLIEQTHFAAADVLAALTTLECAGLIKDDAGKGYIRLNTND